MKRSVTKIILYFNDHYHDNGKSKLHWHIATLAYVKTYFMWEEKENSLYRKFEFKDFNEAFGFMSRIALISEKMDHHPKWTNVWNTVEIWLSTHSAGNSITDKDKKLAAAIDALK